MLNRMLYPQELLTCTADALGVLFHQHPAKVRIEQALANAVRILVCVGITVMSAMIARPPRKEQQLASYSRSRILAAAYHRTEPSTAPPPTAARNILSGKVAEYDVCAQSL